MIAPGMNVVTQVAIVVRDIERSIDHYSRIFGVEKPPISVTAGYDQTQCTYRGDPSEARAKLAFFHMGQVDIELIEPFNGPSVWQEFLDEKGEGVQHIAFSVKGTDQVVEFFGQNGMAVTQQGNFTGGMYTYLESAPQLGVTIELLEFFNK